MGLALILDNIIVLLCRLLYKSIRERQSRAWSMVTGTIVEKSIERGAYPQAILQYSYAVAGHRFFGSYRKPFWSSDSAYEFIRRVNQPCDVLVRYSPEDSSRSSVRDADQHMLLDTVGRSSLMG